MKTNGKFTVLELWKVKGFKYNHSLLMIAGVNIARSYRTRYITDPENIVVYENETKRKYKVSQYPDKFKKEANKALDRLQKKYPDYLMVVSKKKRPRIKAGV